MIVPVCVRCWAFPRRAHGPRDAEVRHDGRAAREHDVLRFDVAVHDAVTVGVRQRARHFGGDPERVVLRELFLPCQPVAQRFAFDVRHDVIEEAGRRAGVVQGQDVGVLQRAAISILAQEPLGTKGRGELGVGGP